MVSSNIEITLEKSRKVKTDIGYSAFIKFEYNESLVADVRTLPTRYWITPEKIWEIPIEDLPKFLNKVSKYTVTIKGIERDYLRCADEPVISDVTPEQMQGIYRCLKTRPLSHQIDAIRYGITHQKFILGDQPGLGKTLSVLALAAYNKLYQNHKHVLVICGINYLKHNWVAEINKHTNLTCKILGAKTSSKGKTVIGSCSERLNELKHLDKNTYIYITNIETLQNKDIVAQLESLCKKGEINAVYVDEAHKVVNPDAKRSKGLLKLRCNTKVLMTGTPMLNTPLDLWVGLSWLGRENHNFYSYSHYYATYGGYGGYELTGYQHIDELQNVLNECMLRRLKTDVLDLPDKNIIETIVDMDEDQAKVYHDIYDDIMEDIENIKAATNPLTKLLRLRQATSCPEIFAEGTSNAKLECLDNIIAERVQNGSKLVLFSQWTTVTDILLERYKNYNPATITGKVCDADRPQQEAKFRTDDTCKLFIGSIQALGAGVTLTAADTVVFVDEPWNAANEEQASDRVHRIGIKAGTEHIDIIILIVRDTMDMRVREIVKGKGTMADTIIDGKATHLDKSKMVDFLLS